MDPQLMAMLQGGMPPGPGIPGEPGPQMAPNVAARMMDVPAVVPTAPPAGMPMPAPAPMDMGGAPMMDMGGAPMMPPPPPGGGAPMDMMAGGPMNASPLPSTDPGQIMALLSQFAADDQLKAIQMALAETKMAQAQAIQPVAAAMLEQAMSQATTMDGPGGGMGSYAGGEMGAY